MAAAPHLELSAGTTRMWVVMARATPSMSSAWPFLECPRCWFLGWVLSTHKYVSWVTLNVVKSTRKIIPHSPGGPLQEHSGFPHLQVNGLAHPLLLHSLEPPYVSFSEFWLGAPHPTPDSPGFWLWHYPQFHFQTFNPLLRNRNMVPRARVLRLARGWAVRRKGMEIRAAPASFSHTAAFKVTWGGGCQPPPAWGGRSYRHLPHPNPCPSLFGGAGTMNSWGSQVLPG